MHNHSRACTQTHISLYYQLCEDIYWHRGAHIQSKPVLNGLNEAGVLSSRWTGPSHLNPTQTVCQRWTETFCLKSEANNEVTDVQHQRDLLEAASKSLAPTHADSFSSMKYLIQETFFATYNTKPGLNQTKSEPSNTPLK